MNTGYQRILQCLLLISLLPTTLPVTSAQQDGIHNPELIIMYDHCFIPHVDITLQPHGVEVRPLYGQIVYTCYVPNGAETVWLINGIDLQALALTGVMTDSIGVITSLTFTNLTKEFNETTVECRFTSKIGSSGISTLILQGV